MNLTVACVSLSDLVCVDNTLRTGDMCFLHVRGEAVCKDSSVRFEYPLLPPKEDDVLRQPQCDIATDQFDFVAVLRILTALVLL